MCRHYEILSTDSNSDVQRDRELARPLEVYRFSMPPIDRKNEYPHVAQGNKC
jgi:hypothetical protein